MENETYKAGIGSDGESAAAAKKAKEEMEKATPANPGSDNNTLNSIVKRSIAGIDIVAAVGTTIFAGLTGLTVSIQREKAPLYTMGNTNPWSYSRGKRGIAGAMTFATFDRTALHQALAGTKYATYLGKQVELGNARGGVAGDGKAKDKLNVTIKDAADTTVSLGTHVVARAQYADQFMPFDIVVIGMNEYGGGSLMSVRQIEIVNENRSMSVDDIQIEESMTYVATHVLPWTPISYDLESASSAQGVSIAEVLGNPGDIKLESIV